MIIKETVIRGMMDEDSPCKPRSETVVESRVTVVCSTCLKVISLAISKSSKCPICASTYDTSMSPIVRFLAKEVEPIGTSITEDTDLGHDIVDI